MKTYDLKWVILIVGGVAISGFGEEGGIEIEPAADIGDVTVGADGRAVMSRSNNRGYTCKITLMETSVAYRTLAGLMSAQQAAPAILPIGFLMNDVINGDMVSSPSPTFTKRPSMPKRKKVGERVFELFLPDCTVVHGALTTP